MLCYLFFSPWNLSLDIKNRNPNKTIFYLSHLRTEFSNSSLNIEETPQSLTVTGGSLQKYAAAKLLRIDEMLLPNKNAINIEG